MITGSLGGQIHEIHHGFTTDSPCGPPWQACGVVSWSNSRANREHRGEGTVLRVQAARVLCFFSKKSKIKAGWIRISDSHGENG